MLYSAISTTLCYLLLATTPTLAVKRGDFKTCDQSGFCKRNRALADRANAATTAWNSPYTFSSPSFKDGVLSARLSNAVFPSIQYSLKVQFQQDGVARILMDEVDGLRQRYNEAGMWAVQTTPALATQEGDYTISLGASASSIGYKGGAHELRIEHSPVKLTFLRNGQEHVILNGKGLLNMEHFRVKTPAKAEATQVEGEEAMLVQEADSTVVQPLDVDFPGFLPTNEDGMWEETFSGKVDTKPKGPESLSLDITFPGYEHVYGIPQHASSLSLKQTRGGEEAYTDPYRLYNLDVFEYDADSEMAIYGSIPFMKAHRAGSTVGVFLVSGSETWIDITKAPTPKSVISAFKKDPNSPDQGPSPTTTSTHWMAESGILDLYIFLGPSSNDIFQQYSSLTGKTPLPQLFAIAYHQCRWNYLSQTDVLDVQSKFDEADIPMDVMWLDIEYADQHEYFIWDRLNFPEPEEMQNQLAERGRKLVAIIDPHIKRDSNLYVYTEAQSLDILQKNPDGSSEFEGWCWTGSSAWPDFFNPKSWDWWIGLFSFEKFKGSTKNLFVWNDMNEPSIFNGPEITMQKDTIHYGGWEHRDVHNIGGMIYQNLTAQGLVRREDPPKRPFVLTRAFFAGSQRFGAMWTGDNLGTWEHLASTVPMLLNNGIAGMTFSGADVGGFFGNPSAEMMVRWYQVGAFSPFFRAHGHIDTKRREPYLFDQPIQGYIRDAIRLRYTLLPAMYTAFYEASLSGIPILRPQFVMFPLDTKGFSVDNQFYLGSSGLLVKPVVAEGATEINVYIADAEPYYHYSTHDIFFGNPAGGAEIKVPAPLDSIPALHRGGSILTRRDLVRRSSILTWKDPITLVVALDITGTKATGSIYLDDGESYSNEKGDFVWRGFQLDSGTSSSKNLVLKSRSLQPESTSTGIGAYSPSENGWAKKIADVAVRKIVILGLATKPSCIKKAGSGVGLEFEWTSGVAATANRRNGGAGKRSSELLIKDADALVVQDWDIVFEFSSAICSTVPIVEPPTGDFLCQNEGHITSRILRSRVNDGICDPECCDGTDETDGKVDCPNRCVEIGLAYRKKVDEDARKNRVGGAIRQEYITFGGKERRKLQSEVEGLSKDLSRLEEREKNLKVALDIAENEEEGETERKKSSALYTSIVEMQSAIRGLRARRDLLDSQVADLSSILGDLSRDFNPNYQDMAVLGASRAFKDWQVLTSCAKPEGGDVAENGESPSRDAPANEADAEEPVHQHSDRELQALEDEDPLTLIDSLLSGSPRPTSGTASIFNLEEYLPEALRAQFQLSRRSLLDLLGRFGIIDPKVAAEDRADRPGITRARTAHSDVANQITDTKNKIEELEKTLSKDWGRDWEWKKLEGTCVEKNMGEYTYSVCFFGQATQTSNKDNSKTSLGNFVSWSPQATSKEEEGYYLKQLYGDGQRCWNGPARSAKVDLICAPTNALLAVIEPEKCEYRFTVSTPAVCFPPPSQSTRDEL